jgi:mRNA interferase MazF
MHRGEIWWASLPPPTGSEPGYRRPVLVVSSDDFNDTKINTVVVAAITSNVRLGAAPGNVLLKMHDSALSRDSVVNVSQILTVNKSSLTEKVTTLTGAALARVEDGLRLVLALSQRR